MGVAPEQNEALVVVLVRVVVGKFVVLRVVTVVEMGLEDVDSVLWGIVEVTLEGLVPSGPEVILGVVVVEVLEVALEVVVPGGPEVTPKVVPDVLGNADEAVVLVKDEPGIASVEDATIVVDVPAAEGEDELGCGAPVVVPDAPIVERELGVVVDGGGC